MSTIVLANLHKRFGDFTAVRDTNLTVGAGRFVVLLGPSGCGKTTTLRMIAGLELPTSGKILIDGEDVTSLRARQRDIAFVFQMFALYPHMTVRNNIAFPLKNEGVPRREILAVQRGTLVGREIDGDAALRERDGERLGWKQMTARAPGRDHHQRQIFWRLAGCVHQAGLPASAGAAALPIASAFGRSRVSASSMPMP